MKIADLHVHSVLSDGLYSPEEIVNTAVHKNLGGFALTDHDTFEGVGACLRAIKRFTPPIYFIAGCEFSTYNADTGETHILGYFSGESYREMDGFLEEFRRGRKKRAGRILECLKKYHIDIPLEALLQRSSKPVGRMHIAREMVRLKYTGSVREAFEKYLGEGRPCNIERKEVGTYDVISAVKSAGGVPVLAHPVFLKSGDKWGCVDRMISAGLAGIEYMHPRISKGFSARIAEEYSKKLILTAGSDFHGDDESDEIGRFGISLEDAERILPRFREKVGSL